MNILQICNKPPYPAIDGGSKAMYSLYEGLTADGANVHVLAMNTYKQYCRINNVPESFRDQSNYTLVDVDIRLRVLPAFLNLFTHKSYNIERFDSADFKSELTRILNENTYDVIILESLYTTPYLDLLRENTQAILVCRTHNIEFKIWENLANNEKNGLKKWYLKLLSRRLKNYELKTLEKVDLIASISQEDNLILQKESIQTRMMHLPFGINMNDEEYCDYAEPESDELVLFHLGSMDWIPHQEAFRWFLEKVWKSVHAKSPDIQLHLAGSKMPDWITHGNYPNVVVTNGYVDGKSFMTKKAIMIVPSFSGSGIRIKIAEGMAKGKVILTTKNGAMGIPCTHGENIFISDDCDEWEHIISACFSDIELVKKTSKNARTFSQTAFDYKSAAKKLIDSLVDTR